MHFHCTTNNVRQQASHPNALPLRQLWLFRGYSPLTANRADTPLTTAETGYAEIKADLNAAEVLKNACEMWRKSKLKQVAWHQRRRVQTAVDIKPHGASKAVRVMAEL